MASEDSGQAGFESVRERYQSQGQEHVFRFWERLDDAQRGLLASQAASIDIPPLQSALAAGLAVHAEAPRKLAPPQVEPLPEHGGDPERRAAARSRGQDLLGAGRAATMVVAGGQATRLGYPGPKGLFPLGPVGERSLFEIQAQKIRGLRRRFDQPIPWYIMTSEATDAATREAFARQDHFGLPAEDIFFFSQGMVPSFDFDGRLILELPERIMQNPNGHGGSLTALLDSGALDDMERRGIDTIFYYQVDNPLVQMADPVYLGFHDLAGAEMSCKVIRKQDPMEKVGVLARSNGKLGVVEYTEIDDEHRFATDHAGELVYWAGNAAIHVFATSFVRRIAAEADRWLPFHVSEKKIPILDAEGRPQPAAEPNGRKLERFVFDALPAAAEVCIVEAGRSDEYAPVKNAEGTDSPVTARRALLAQYRSWLEAGGIELPPADQAIEVDHSRIDGPDDARALELRTLAELGAAVRTGPGVAG